MSFAHARWSEEHHVLGALDEGEAAQFHDLLARRADREAEVVLVWVLIAGKPATRANISRARARRDSRSATSNSSRKSVNEVRPQPPSRAPSSPNRAANRASTAIPLPVSPRRPAQ